MTQITFGSVCSGIEAASVAWEPLGWKAAWLAEIEPFPCGLLAHHYPDIPNLGNMLRIPELLRNGDIPPPDVFTGGTPCQAFSLAGLRNSLDDARGNLSLTFCEIANEIDIQRAANGLLPCVVVWENVPGVLSTKDNAFGYFLAGLAGEDDPLVAPGAKWSDAGCVYGPQRAVAWRVLDAQYFGLAQRRRRVFVVASARAGFDPAAVLFEFDGVRRDTAPSREAGQDTAGTLASRTDGGGFPGTDEACSGYVQPVDSVLRGGNTSGAISVAACLTAKGQRIDFEVETFAVQPTLSVALRGREGGGTAELGDDLSNCLRASTGGGDKPYVLAPIAFDSRQECVRSTEVFGALGSSSPQAQAVAFSCKDYGADATIELAPAMRAMGHSTSHANAGGQLAVCVTGDITHTLKAEGFDASEDGTGRGQPIVAVNFNRSSDGELVNGARQGEGDLLPRAVRTMREAEGGSASQEPGLARSFAGELAAPVPQLPLEGPPRWREVHAVRQPAQGAGVLRNALPAIQDMGRPDAGKGQPVQPGAQGFGIEPGQEVQGGWLPIEDARARILREACDSGQSRPARENQQHQSRSDGARMGYAASAVRRLTPRECERLQGFPDDYTLIPYGRRVSEEKLDRDFIKYQLRGNPKHLTREDIGGLAADGPRYKALGNSWAILVVRRIGTRINKALQEAA